VVRVNLAVIQPNFTGLGEASHGDQEEVGREKKVRSVGDEARIGA
jgi:hypothetical protein